MKTVLIIYYSRTGNTKKMAKIVEEGVSLEDVKAEVKSVDKVTVAELLKVDGIIIGSPTYYGSMAAEIKKLLDDSVKYHGKLEGKVGAAFTSSNNIGGGNETTILDILNAFLVHGMVIQGTSSGDHYGPVAIGAPDNRAAGQCKDLGRRVARLVKRLAK